VHSIRRKKGNKNDYPLLHQFGQVRGAKSARVTRVVVDGWTRNSSQSTKGARSPDQTIEEKQ